MNSAKTFQNPTMMTNSTVKVCTLGVQSPSLQYCCSSYTVNSEMCITSTISVLVLPSSSFLIIHLVCVIYTSAEQCHSREDCVQDEQYKIQEWN